MSHNKTTSTDIKSRIYNSVNSTPKYNPAELSFKKEEITKRFYSLDYSKFIKDKQIHQISFRDCIFTDSFLLKGINYNVEFNNCFFAKNLNLEGLANKHSVIIVNNTKVEGKCSIGICGYIGFNNLVTPKLSIWRGPLNTLKMKLGIGSVFTKQFTCRSLLEHEGLNIFNCHASMLNVARGLFPNTPIDSIFTDWDNLYISQAHEKV